MFFKFSQIKFKSLAPLILASLGLIWQVHSISKVYFQFNTRVDIVIDAPDRLSMPGLTVCVILSDGLGPRGPFIRESELIYMPINETLEFGKPEVDVVCTVPAPELVRLNPNDSGLFCQNFAPPKISIQYISPGLVARCETFFYRYFNQSPYEVIAADAKDFYRIELSRVTNATILFFIHSPTDVLHLSEADTITLNIIQTQEIVLATTKFTTNFMPPPFRTNCRYYHDYEYGQWGCVFQCRVKRKQQVCPAWPWNVPASPDIDVPFKVHDEQRCSQKSTGHDCFDSDCHQPQCWNEWYTTTTIYSKERSNNHQLSKLYIRRPFGVEFVYNYVPRLAQIEFICYVASCFGIWLGVSCADALRYVAHLATESRFVNRSKLVQSQASVTSSKMENGWTESKIATINGKNALMATKMKSFGRFEQMRPRKIVSYNSSFY